MSAIPAGYKQTEVGVIPEDWEVARLSSVSRTPVQNGVFNEPARKGRGCKLINVGDLYTAAPIDINNLEKFDATKTEISKFGVTHGDLFFTRSSITPDGIAYCNIYDQTTREDIVFDCHIIRVQADNKKVDPFFLAKFCVTRPARIYLVANAKTTTMTTVDQAVIGGLPVPLPPLAEQRAIAAALSDVDALLAKVDQFIVKKRDIKQAVMQQLLTGKKRLPGFSGEWEVKPMKSLGNTYGGLTGKTKIDFGHGRARYIPFMNVMTDTVIDAEWLEAVDVASNEMQNLTQKGDLFFNGSSETPEEVGFCSVLLQDIPNLYLNSFCFGFRFNADAKINGLFFAYWFRSVKGRETMAVLAQGATRYNIAKSAFLRLELPQPTEAEQTAIATVLSDMDAEIAALEQRRNKTRALKQGMMQELLTGRIRLV
ncbi:MAG TPA: restriction endonuclease subunit S [Candidatus Propionivibrio aalborgensis]|nr:restriction endonuclease subunit S [Candidatus Propionivibrio aalborgensis]